MQQAPVAGAPDSRDTVDAAADDERAVRTEGSGMDRPELATQHADLLAWYPRSGPSHRLRR